ncbi:MULTISPECIES: hypothetical protein [unclassified Sphingopyxis]|uniref:hypothetical protein n=1 Tax=unclassified Sphingopyxis TaxID=2614943 RepID=UPI0007366B24|nr:MULTISPECIES: hypothetical protein [unclassified Sphingopyxis]KTE31789.1 hypothetical protein ATE62_19175 [Sphingopyxis sp. HIX]KTE82449.1 hypothetical protein ATE72_15510 [Sphingopyxis sp. HXXIV]
MSSDAPPFAFREEGRHLVDDANGLLIQLYQWPEYEFTVAVQPAPGRPHADAWPVSARAFFEFGIGFDKALERHWISFAQAHRNVDDHYPGRYSELLECVLPLVGPFFLREAGYGRGRPFAPPSERLRPMLAERGSWFAFRDGD